MLESIAASIFVTLSGPPEFCDTKAAISVCASFTILVPISWPASTLCAYNSLLLCPDVSFNIPCAHSARLLCGDIDAVYHTPARVSSVVVHLDLYHRLVHRRRRSGQAPFRVSSSNPPTRNVRSYAPIRLVPSAFNFFDPSRRGEPTLRRSKCREAATIIAYPVECMVGTSSPRSAW
jgi:hypothetical protein